MAFFGVPVVYAAACDDWLEHLRVDHRVHIIKSVPGIVNDSMKIVRIPKSKLTLLFPENENWSVVHASAERIEVRNQAFGYGVSLKADRCQNSYGWAVEAADRRSFNYDWAICEEILSIFKGDKMSNYESIRNRKRPSEAKDDIEKLARFREQQDRELETEFLKIQSNLSSNEKVKQSKLVDRANSGHFSNFKLSVLKLYEKCEGQTAFLALSKNKSTNSGGTSSKPESLKR